MQLFLDELEMIWKRHLTDEFKKPYMTELLEFLRKRENASTVIFPPKSEIFTAFKLTPFKSVKVVILGQDPYHGTDQAHGLSFSVQKGRKIPPSLKNIYKELQRDLEIPQPSTGSLGSWARQGALLLNTVLTVEAGQAGSHRNKGWEALTDSVIAKLNAERQNLVFLLWGNPAIAKSKLIDATRHLILTSPHPSPLSAHRGFLGNGHFSATNNYLKQHDITPINWAIPEEQTTLL